MIQILSLGLIFGAVILLVQGSFPSFYEIILGLEKRQAEKIKPHLERMFLYVSPKRLGLMLVGVPMVLGAVSLAAFKNPIVAVIVAVAGLVIPTFIVKRMEHSRRDKFTSQLVDAMMILSAALKAGLSLIQAFEALVEELPPPVSQEFGLMLREHRMGLSFPDALNNLKKRIPSEELDLIITSILVARQTGGDLTQTFSQLGFTIRERNKLFGKVKVMTLQGRLQGFIMSIIPIAFAIFVFSVNKDFFNVMLQDKLGKMLLIYAVVSEAMGIFFITKLSKVEV